MNIIFDIGSKFTKVGFGGETEPRKILETPSFFDFEKYMDDDTSKQWKVSNEIERINFEVNYDNK
jgi:actin-related protein